MNKKSLIGGTLLFVIGTILGAGGGYSVSLATTRYESTYYPVRAEGNEFRFINPLLAYETPNSSSEPEYEPLAEEIQKLVDEFVAKSKPGASASVYYRDSTVAHWIGINEEVRYTPASLLKVALMTAHLKMEDDAKGWLQNPIIYSAEINNLIGAVPHDRGTELIVGQTYTVEELVRYMIIKSDNGATYALLNIVDDGILDQLYQDVRLENPANLGRDYTISVRDYAFFFRLLYNATYLSHELSDKALQLLNNAEFEDGIAYAIHREVAVAHKYGEAVITDNTGQVKYLEQHDCGYVYHLTRPYLLCVMTKGDKLEEMTRLLQRISETVYADVKNR